MNSKNQSQKFLQNQNNNKGKNSKKYIDNKNNKQTRKQAINTQIKNPFKTIDIYLTPRFYKNQLVHDGRHPLTLFKQKVILNGKRTYDQLTPYSPKLIQNLKKQDGLIYQLGKFKSTYKLKRGIKFLICVTLYNQSLALLQRTINGIYDNLKHMQKKNLHHKEIAVVVIQDGITKLCKQRATRQLLDTVNFISQLDKRNKKRQCKLIQRINIILDQYQKYQKNGQANYCISDVAPTIPLNIGLLYQTAYTPRTLTSTSNTTLPHLQLFFLFKHRNAKKLSSHMWFFQGFCRYIEPQYCAVVDAGIMPHQKGLLNFVIELEKDPHLGGVSGCIDVDIQLEQQVYENYNTEQEQGCCKDLKNYVSEKNWKIQCCYPIPPLSTIGAILFVFYDFLLYLVKSFCILFTYFHNIFSIQRAQKFEYIYGQILDKNFESFFGFLNVLPGAWSAYRYKALSQGLKYEKSLLEKKYLKPALDPDATQRDFKEANMYLGEDRILSMGIYCQPGYSFRLKYISHALAFADCINNLIDFISQRRRWINSTIYAFEYVFRNYSYEVDKSKHSCVSKNIFLPLTMFVSWLALINTYFTPTFYFFTLYNSVFGLIQYIEVNVTSSVNIDTTVVQGKQWIVILLRLFAVFMILLYIVIILILVGISLNYKLKDQKAKNIYIIMTGLIGFVNFLVLGIAFAFIIINYFTGQGFDSNNLGADQIIVIVGISVYVGGNTLIFLFNMITNCKQICSLLDPRTLLSYLYYQGAYTHTLIIYSFCNIDDVTWGTKGIQSKQTTSYHTDKVEHLKTWLLHNAIFSFVLIIANELLSRQGSAYIIIVLALYTTALFAFKLIVAIINHSIFIIGRICNSCTPYKFSYDEFKTIDNFQINNKQILQANNNSMNNIGPHITSIQH